MPPRRRGSTRRSRRLRARGRLAADRCRARADRYVTASWAWDEGTKGVGRSLFVSVAPMARLHFGPARVPSQESPEAAIELLQERGYTACEIDFEGRFWMDYPWAERFGELAREAGIVLSVHAPIAGFVGHAERGKKLNMAIGMLDHSAGVAVAAGAELVVFHPGFLLGRSREQAIDSVVEQLAELRERLVAKGRAVPFGVEIMGRVRDLGT